jgi:transcriptional regulator with XRE-family HTH domain
VRLKELREEANITQEELGNQIGQTKSNISKYENGLLEPNIDTLRLLSQYFDVSVDYLLGISNERSHRSTKNSSFDIDSLSEDSKSDLKKYIELLKIKDIKEKNEKHKEYNHSNSSE